ncbi:hypothetical protein A0U93_03865 [Neoasaia chiangmaiensis]|uniref:Yellow n=2 Tax=Neoasaia chiangmaiensis TaxID=320497 RepID=A0A1U9KNE4_9PROT|nr:hypothetical protein A0U93_03865 [Neoasaia chiangmaiensis]
MFPRHGLGRPHRLPFGWTGIVSMRIGLALLAISSPSAMADRPWEPAAAPAKLRSDLPLAGSWHSVATSHGGLIVAQREAVPHDDAPQVVAINGTSPAKPYPDGSWYDAAAPAEHRIFSATALSADVRGDIWLLDSGDSTRGNAGAKILHFDGDTGQLRKAWPLPAQIVVANSHFTAVQVHLPYIYLADEGRPALATLDTRDGRGRRFLADDPSLRGRRAMIVDGAPVMRDGHPVERDVSMLALTPDAHWLFYQPPCGPLYRLDTALLTDPAYSPVEQLDGIVEWRDTPTLGGLAIDRNNTLYLIDRAAGRLLSFDAARMPRILLSDPRLTQGGNPGLENAQDMLDVPVGGDHPGILRISLPPS